MTEPELFAAVEIVRFTRGSPQQYHAEFVASPAVRHGKLQERCQVFLFMLRTSNLPVLASAVQSTSPDGAIEGLVQSRGRSPPTPVRLLGTVRARLMLAPNLSPVFRLAHLVVVSRHAGCATAAPRGVTHQWYTQGALEDRFEPVYSSAQLTKQTRA